MWAQVLENMYKWKVTSGNKCKGCYTTNNVYYCFTDIDSNNWPSCEKCLDKVRKMRNDKVL